MPVRKNVTSLTAQEKADFVAAIKRCKAAGLYDQFVVEHSQSMMTPSPPNVSPNVRNVAHRGPAFCPWHREFLRRFEQAIGVPLPYWDWAADQDSGDPQHAAVWGNDLMGGNGVPPDDHVTTGPFAHDPNDSTSWSTVQDPKLPANQQDNSVPWLTREFGGMGSLPTTNDVAMCMTVVPYDSDPWDTTSDPSFRNRLEGWVGPGLHNAAHMWVGGSMMPSTSPNDPVFFLHHANVDRIWANWQRQYYGTQDYLPASGGPIGHNLNDPMLPWQGSSTPASVLDTFALGYWYDDAPVPQVAGLGTAQGDVAGGTIVRIAGSGFVGTTSVAFGSATASFTVDADGQITATAPPAVSPGAVDVIVTTPVGSSTPNSSDVFTYTTTTAIPVISSIQPTSGAVGTVVTIVGSGFTGATGVGFGNTGSVQVSLDSDTQISAQAPTGNGTVDVTVVGPGGTSSTVPSDLFTYT
jgi:tyrosinase